MPRPHRAALAALALATVAVGLGGVAWWSAQRTAHARILEALANAELDDDVLIDDVRVHPIRGAASVEGVRIRPADGVGRHHDLIAFDALHCDQLAFQGDLLVQARCEALDGTLNGDVAVGLAGLREGLPWPLGNLPLDVGAYWSLDATTRTWRAETRLRLPGRFDVGCDVRLAGVGLDTWAVVTQIVGVATEHDPRTEGDAYARALDEALGEQVPAVRDLAIRSLGCELVDDGLHARMIEDPTFGIRFGASARLALAMVDPLSTDAVSHFLKEGGALRLGTRTTDAEDPIPVFVRQEDGALTAGPALEHPLDATRFGVTWTATASEPR